MKKIVSCLLTVMLAMMLGAQTYAAGVFPDVTDLQTATNTSTLYMMGILNGDANGRFNGSASLTRAQFCKMAIIAMGLGDDEPMYRNRTIFPDVSASHWARGYINLAVSGEKKIIQGNGDGSFKPDSTINYAQAITILARVLGYSDKDAGYMWPEGYLSLAKDIGLADGINLSATSGISRADAARLFCNLLRTDVKGGSEYITSLGSVRTDVIILDINAKSADGSENAVYTSSGTYKMKSGKMPEEFLGMKGSILLDKDGKIKTFLEETDTIRKTIVVSEVQASWVKDNNGNKYDIDSTDAAYTAEKATTYGDLWTSINAGQSIIIYFDNSQNVEAVFVNSKKSENVQIADDGGSAKVFSRILNGDNDYIIYKNGVQVTESDICKYDVATYDSMSKILNISDFRVTACYENAYPNAVCPEKITVMGHEFEVLEAAYSSLGRFKIGDKATFLFTSDNKVAGVVGANSVSSTAVGIMQSSSQSSVSVKLLNGITVSGKSSISQDSLDKLAGTLVSVSSNGQGKISVTKIQTSGNKYGRLDMKNLKLGNIDIGNDVMIFERVGNSVASQISKDDIADDVISGDKVLYARRNANGKINLLVLEDITGDIYTYGFMKYSASISENEDVVVNNGSVTVKNSGKNKTVGSLSTKTAYANDVAVGIVGTTDGKLAGYIKLVKAENVSRSDFYTDDGETTVKVKGMTFGVSEIVECYNKSTDGWFDSLDDALKFSDKFTVYYDKLPSEGGKIRMIVAEK